MSRNSWHEIELQSLATALAGFVELNEPYTTDDVIEVVSADIDVCRTDSAIYTETMRMRYAAEGYVYASDNRNQNCLDLYKARRAALRAADITLGGSDERYRVLPPAERKGVTKRRTIPTTRARHVTQLTNVFELSSAQASLVEIPHNKLILMQALSAETLTSRINSILERENDPALSVAAVKRYRNGLLNPIESYKNGPPPAFVNAVRQL